MSKVEVGEVMEPCKTAIGAQNGPVETVQLRGSEHTGLDHSWECVITALSSCGHWSSGGLEVGSWDQVALDGEVGAQE